MWPEIVIKGSLDIRASVLVYLGKQDKMSARLEAILIGILKQQQLDFLLQFNTVKCFFFLNLQN